MRNFEAGNFWKHDRKLAYSFVRVLLLGVATLGLFLQGGILLSMSSIAPDQHRHLSVRQARNEYRFDDNNGKGLVAESTLEVNTSILADTSKAEFETEKEDDVAHVFLTRFMLNQPNLLELGKARLEMFRTMCLPTMEKQTSQNFIWVIQTDHQLHPILKEEMTKSIHDKPNFFLVAFNDTFVEGHYSFRGRTLEKLAATPGDVWSGSYEKLRAYHEKSQKTTMIQTQLDADDGIHVRFVEAVQARVKESLTDPYEWLVFCAGKHFEWQYYNPFDNMTDVGFLVREQWGFCVTPGLTRVHGSKRRIHPKGNHYKMTVNLVKCQHVNSTGCIVYLDDIDLLPSALRARTPTSAGMQNVFSESTTTTNSMYQRKAEQQQEFQDEMWELTKYSFGVEREHVVAMRRYFVNHTQEIIEDALEGQCRHGHSCKNESVARLNTLLSNAKARTS